uniref:Uncharacterized protein n=1 Tax=Brugia timori TaxID=42155 RepID=A0A0R3Q860_9BILA
LANTSKLCNKSSISVSLHRRKFINFLVRNKNTKIPISLQMN